MRRALLFLFSHRFLALARWDLYFLRVRLRNAITLQGCRMRHAAAAMPRPLFLNIGSGPRGLDDPHWVNIDGFRGHNVRWLLDITRPLPFNDEAFDGVFCEHVLEHFSLDDAHVIASEVLRVLRPGGTLRVVVPDAELVMRRYLESPGELLARRVDAGITPMEVVNSYFRQRYEHQFLYDWPTMRQLLQSTGFRQVSRTSFRQAPGCAAIALDDEKYEWESLYVEAQKGPISQDP